MGATKTVFINPNHWLWPLSLVACFSIGSCTLLERQKMIERRPVRNKKVYCRNVTNPAGYPPGVFEFCKVAFGE